MIFAHKDFTYSVVPEWETTDGRTLYKVTKWNRQGVMVDVYSIFANTPQEAEQIIKNI